MCNYVFCSNNCSVIAARCKSRKSWHSRVTKNTSTKYAKRRLVYESILHTKHAWSLITLGKVKLSFSELILPLRQNFLGNTIDWSLIHSSIMLMGHIISTNWHSCAVIKYLDSQLFMMNFYVCLHPRIGICISSHGKNPFQHSQAFQVRTSVTW